MLDMFSIAVFLFSLALRAYLVTYLRLACPNMAAMSTGLIFLRTRSVAKEWRAVWNIQGEASNNEQVKIKRKSFEMSCISVFCKMWKMQTTTEY